MAEEEKEALLSKDDGDRPPDVPVHKGYGARHTFCIMTFWGYFMSYAMRFSMSVAIVAMTNSTTSKSNSSVECPDHNLNSTSRTTQDAAEFDWDEAEQGLILSSFFYGYIITQIPAGRMAEIVGGKHLFGCGILVTAVCTLLTPLLARVGVWALIAARVIEGLGEGLTIPAQYAMQGKWTPSQERTFLTTLTSAGFAVGNIACFPICGYLSQTDFLGGWPSNFYLFGTTSCIWWILWCLLIYETPADHPRISAEEKAYVEAFSGTKKEKKVPSPWKQMLTSRAVWALNICSFLASFEYYIILTSVPTYMSRVLKFDITEDGLLMALPNVSNVVISVAAALLSDILLNRKLFSITFVRKLAILTGGLVAAACFPVISLVGCEHYIVVVLLVLCNGFLGICGTTLTTNILDIGNHFAGSLMGIVSFSSNLPGVIAPYLVGVIINHNDTMHQWNIVFMLSMGLTIFGCLVYVVFGSGNSQSWNYHTNYTVDIQTDTDDESRGHINSRTISRTVHARDVAVTGNIQ